MRTKKGDRADRVVLRRDTAPAIRRREAIDPPETRSVESAAKIAAANDLIERGNDDQRRRFVAGRCTQQRLQRIHAERFRQHRIRASPLGLGHQLGRAVAGHQDHPRRRGDVHDLSDELQPFETERAGELDVGDDVGDRLGPEDDLRRFEIAADDDAPSGAFERDRETESDGRVVIDDEDGLHFGQRAPASAAPSLKHRQECLCHTKC